MVVTRRLPCTPHNSHRADVATLWQLRGLRDNYGVCMAVTGSMWWLLDGCRVRPITVGGRSNLVAVTRSMWQLWVCMAVTGSMWWLLEGCRVRPITVMYIP